MKNYIGLSLAAISLSMFAFTTPTLAATISTQMDIGAQNADVTTLQQSLATDSSLYPQGLVTGYFGSLTAAAVQRFQTRHNIVSSGTAATTGYGRVGPSTLAKFNEVYGGGSVSYADTSPTISSVMISTTTNAATVQWNTDQQATGIIYYSTSPLVVSEATSPADRIGVSGTNVQTATASLGTAKSLTLSNLSSQTTYYYMIQSINGSGRISVTWPSTFRTN